METVKISNLKKDIIKIDKTTKKIILDDHLNNIDEICYFLENIDDKIIVVSKYEENIKNEFTKRKTYQGFNKSILNKVKQIISDNVTKNDLTIDMTIGNGYDTVFLAKNSQFVFGFDIQEEAIINTTQKLKDNNLTNYQLFLENHNNVSKILKEYRKKMSLIIFNLGYLPGANKTIMTKAESTLKAFQGSYHLLKKDGIILIVFYPHDEGKKEAMVIKGYLKENNIKYEEYHNTTKEYAPYLIKITKLFD